MNESIKPQPETSHQENRDTKIGSLLNLLRQKLHLNSVPAGQFSLDNFPLLP